MTTKYFAILTNQGAARLANATALGTKLNISKMAVGDGNGTLPTPNPVQTKLINQTRIAPINSLGVDANDAGQIIAEQIIPENEGGFFIREIGLYDDDGVLIAVANCPETYKPLLAEGSGRTQTIRMILVVSSTAAITLKIDPSVVLATRKYVDDAVIEVKAYADKLMKDHVAKANPHTQYPLTANALKELADAGLVEKTLKNLGIDGAILFRGNIPANTTANQLSPVTGRGQWAQGTSTGATMANGYPEDNCVGICDVIGGGNYGGTQIFYTRSGNIYIRSLTAKWNGSDGPWSDWVNTSTANVRNIPSDATSLADPRYFYGQHIYTINMAMPDMPDGIPNSASIIHSLKRNYGAGASLVQWLHLSGGRVMYRNGSTAGSNTAWTAIAWQGGDANGWREVAMTDSPVFTGAATIPEIAGSTKVGGKLEVYNSIQLGYRLLMTRQSAGFLPYQTFTRPDMPSAPTTNTEIGRVVYGYCMTDNDTFGTGGILAYTQAFAKAGGGGSYRIGTNDAGAKTTSGIDFDGSTGKASFIGDVVFPGLVEFKNPAAALENLGLAALGIGGAGTPLAALDWQTFDFVPDACYAVRGDKMTNMPTGLVFPADKSVQIIINVTGYEGSTRHLEIWFSTITAEFKKYMIRMSGAVGGRVFRYRQIWTSSDVIPITSGGTGATTVAGALENLGLNKPSIGEAPIGIPFYWSAEKMPNELVPQWSKHVYLKWNGATFDPKVFPVLALVNPSCVLADMRGEFIRVWDDGRGVDAGRAFMSHQDSAAPNITGAVPATAYSIFPQSLVGAIQSGVGWVGNDADKHNVNLTSGMNFDAGRCWGGYRNDVTEARPGNTAMNFLVRAA